MFLVIICFPVLILINFTLCLILSITSIVWFPIPLIAITVSELLFYDFDNRRDEDWLPLRCHTVLPLIRTILDLILLGNYY